MSFSFFGMKGAYKPQQLCYVKSLFLSVHAMNVCCIKYYTTMIQDELQKGCWTHLILVFKNAIRKSNATKVCVRWNNPFDCRQIMPLQVSGDSASFYPQATTPTTWTSIVGVQTRGSVTWVFRLNGCIRVSEGASVVEPHRGADPLCWGGRGAGEGRRLGSQCPRLKRADGWFVTVVAMVGFP